MCTYTYVHILHFHLYHSVNIYSDWLWEHFCNLSLCTLDVLPAQQIFFKKSVSASIRVVVSNRSECTFGVSVTE